MVQIRVYVFTNISVAVLPVLYKSWFGSGTEVFDARSELDLKFWPGAHPCIDYWRSLSGVRLAVVL